MAHPWPRISVVAQSCGAVRQAAPTAGDLKCKAFANHPMRVVSNPRQDTGPFQVHGFYPSRLRSFREFRYWPGRGPDPPNHPMPGQPRQQEAHHLRQIGLPAHEWRLKYHEFHPSLPRSEPACRLIQPRWYVENDSKSQERQSRKGFLRVWPKRLPDAPSSGRLPQYSQPPTQGRPVRTQDRIRVENVRRVEVPSPSFRGMASQYREDLWRRRQRLEFERFERQPSCEG